MLACPREEGGLFDCALPELAKEKERVMIGLVNGNIKIFFLLNSVRRWCWQSSEAAKVSRNEYVADFY